MTPTPQHLHHGARRLVTLAALLTLQACVTPVTTPGAAATTPAAAASSPAWSAGVPALGASAAQSNAAARPGPAASAPVAAPPPPPQPPFALVIKDAKRIDGLLALYQKDDKVWIELQPADFGKLFFLSPKIARGIGEGRVFGGTMIGRDGSFGRSQVVSFRKLHNQVQLLARNQQFLADAGTPQARAVSAAFSDSLLGSVPVASQPHPERKSVLIDASPLFLGDMLGIGAVLQRTYRQSYSLDRSNTGFASVRSQADQVVFNVQAHFATASLATPTPGAPPGAPVPSVPGTLPDARSMFIGLYYSLAKLPEQVMRPRTSDPRVGYFTTAVNNFSTDNRPSPRQRFVNRWRLEKKDPAAELSEPVKPIVFWLDRSVPLAYRDAVTRGILEWNKAFEKIGFKNAVQARQQPDDAPFDTLDVGVASVRFITSADPAFDGFGPSVTDPRSGEILDADIVIDGNAARSMRGLRSQVYNRADPADPDGLAALMQFGNPQRLTALRQHADGAWCDYDAQAAEQFGYALDVLESRGDIAPDSPEAQAFAVERVFAVAMHEVGHALGLRHNFRASRAYTLAQLADPVFTAAHGTAASVMDYSALNLPPPGVPFAGYGAVHRSALGPYDYWAIEYAYKPIAAADEAAALLAIAARSKAPELSYGTDEDNALGVDPESLVFDLGDDPLAYARTRFAIARDLLDRQEARHLAEDADYSPLRRAVRYALRDMASAAGVLTRQIGGVRTLRDYPGSGRDPLLPVPAARQREALELLARQMFAPDAVRVSPALSRRLAPNFEERGEGQDISTDYPVGEVVTTIQRGLLGQLMSDGLAARILDSEAKAEPAVAGRPADAFRLSELYGRLARELWSELDRPQGDIDMARRELQREHVNRIASALMRPSASSRADARALLRAQAKALLPRLAAATQRASLSEEARAHLQEAANTLSLALAAPLVRMGV